ncbi:Hexadecenal dehydrogenase [Microbotryomycetes sp. JL221]|nr:Hexadecenal dehydrogenase [Microbotryomycetes sp. JL221]
MPAFTETSIEAIQPVYDELQTLFKSHKTRQIEWRTNKLRLLKQLITENHSTLCDAVKADFGKPAYETAATELDPFVVEISDAIKNVHKWAKPSKVSAGLQFALMRPTIYHEPKGVALIIGAWNFPVLLVLQPLMAALSAGCPAIIKPSELASNTAATLAALVPKYLDDCVKVVNGAVEQTTALLKLRFDHILYTGNGTVGRIVAEAAAKHLTPLTLELGGKSPVVVFDDANIETAGKRIIWGKYLNAGQICIAPDYVLCSKKTAPKLVEAMKKALAEFSKAHKTAPGDTSELLESNRYTQIISERHFQRISKLLEETHGDVVIGGNTNEATRRIEPTVVTNVDAEDSLMSGEIFGPILPILACDSVQEMIDFINERDNPLALYVFTSNSSNFKLVLDSTRSGGIAQNDVIMHVAPFQLPFGGSGASGYGAYHGKRGFEEFSHHRSSVSVPMWAEFALKFRYPPYSPSKL